MGNNLIEQYKNLCAILGDLILNKESIDKRILEVRAQIEALNQEAAKKQQAGKEPQNEG